MGEQTGIEWCDSTANLQMGCDGCELWNLKTGIKRCYAGTLTERYGGKNGWPVTFGQPALFPERLKRILAWSDLTGRDRPEKPHLNGYPRLIFLDDMGDTFTESLPINWLKPHIPAMVDSPHIFQILTKRPKRAYQFFEQLGYIPANFWLMTSITEQSTANRAIDLLRLRDIEPGVILGLSCEPLWGMLDLEDIAYEAAGPEWAGFNPLIDWVITGGESGHNARPCHPNWIRAIRDQCLKVGTAFFMKQWGEWFPFGSGYIVGNTVVTPDKDKTDWNYRKYCLADGRELVGRFDNYTFDPDKPTFQKMVKVGKKAAGHILDGQVWQQFPKVRKR